MEGRHQFRKVVKIVVRAEQYGRLADEMKGRELGAEMQTCGDLHTCS